MSKSTPRGAVAKFAAGGKPLGKKDLGLIAMSYGDIYVASVAHGREGRAHAQGVHRSRILSRPVADHRLQPLHRPRHRPGFGRRRAPAEARGGIRPVAASTATTRAAPKPARIRCSWIPPRPRSKVQEYLLSENRFKMLTKSKPEDAKRFFAQAQADADRRWKFYQFLAGRDTKSGMDSCRRSRPRPWTNNREPSMIYDHDLHFTDRPR